MQGSEFQTSLQKVEIFLSGRSLKNKDFFSKSDPFVVLFIKNSQQQTWVKVGRTETIQDNLNPNWTKSFVLDYMFEVKQDCKFEVWDEDQTSADFIGQVETTLGKLMGAQKQTTVMDLHIPNTSQTQGKLIARCDTVKDCNEYFTLKMVGVKLMNTDGWFGTSDPFLRFSKIREDHTLQKIFETEVVMNNLNPIWKPFELSVGRLVDGDPNRKFKIECYDWEKDNKFQFIGEVDATLQELKSGKKEYELRNPKKNNPGKLRVDLFQTIIKPSFLDYIRGGLQLNVILAVDFTGSNGTPSSPSSLHFMNPNNLNQYQQAILAVGEILLAYDYDQRIPCYGFGAKTHYPTLFSQQALHCFPLSGNPQMAEAQGIQQIMEQYNYALHNVELAGVYINLKCIKQKPTYFAPIISESVKLAQQMKSQEQNVYNVLLILTDGEIHDMNETKNLIVQAGYLPMSIIIVGIGNADFDNMDVLDGDSGLTNSSGQKASRDIVQFVPFRKHNGNSQLLAKDVLAEIPEQVIKYHLMNGKKPNAPVMTNIAQMGYTTMPSQGPQNQIPNLQVPQQIQPPQGGYVQGLPPQGSFTQGLQQQGMPLQGMSPQGEPIQSVNPYGVPQQTFPNNENVPRTQSLYPQINQGVYPPQQNQLTLDQSYQPNQNFTPQQQYVDPNHLANIGNPMDGNQHSPQPQNVGFSSQPVQQYPPNSYPLNQSYNQQPPQQYPSQQPPNLYPGQQPYQQPMQSTQQNPQNGQLPPQNKQYQYPQNSLGQNQGH